MKKTILPILTLTASLMLLTCCFSCSKPAGAETEDPEKEKVEDNKPKAGDYTFTVSPLKGKWEVGDQIYVHGSYGPGAKTYTLEASQISADGKTATIALDSKMVEYLAAPDNLYAAYPASAVRAEDGLMDAHVTFSKADILLAQAYLEGTNFEFHDASARISFIAKGYAKARIAGTQRPGMRFTEYTNDHSSAKTSFTKVATDGYPYREFEIPADGNMVCWFPGGINLTGGFSIYFEKDGAWSAVYNYSEDQNLKAGKTLDLGDITGKIVPYSGPKPSMPEMGKRTKYTVNFNEWSGICVSEDNDFLWALGDGSELAKVSFDGKLISKTVLRTTSGSSIDSEGISVNYDTGDLIIGGEPASVCRILKNDIPNIFAADKFKGVQGLFIISDAKGFGNAGLEGLTYYKNNQVYCGTQTGSYLFLCDLETGAVISKKGLREMYPVITEIAGLCYDPLTDWLWVIDSESHRFFVLTGDASQLLGFYSMKGTDNPESICVDHSNSCIWVADDYGETSFLYRYDFTGLDDFLIKTK